MAYERKEKEKKEAKEHKDSRESRRQLFLNTMVAPPAQYQVPQFLVMQFQPGQPQYYQQFLVPPGL
uniref:Uncharacterized protein n=1 Tax=Romanomermis culicivorax TaxID=13658 RepID=A0A915JJZ0_ROMCU